MIDRAGGDKTNLPEVATSSYFEGMRVVGIKVLKNKLSEYVKLAASGERILVTDRDKVVAELVAPQVEPNPLMNDPWFAEQVRLGNITPAIAPLTGPPEPLPPEFRVSFEQLMRELDESREDR